MDSDRIARALEFVRPDEVPDIFRAIDLFVRCGIWTADEAEARRIAVRTKVAELSAPEAEA